MPLQKDVSNSIEFIDWYNSLKAMAKDNESSWLVAEDSSLYLSVFLKGISPEDEFQSLLDLAEWKGCGCGG